MRCVRSRKCLRAEVYRVWGGLSERGPMIGGPLSLPRPTEAPQVLRLRWPQNAPNSAQDDNIDYTNFRDRTLAQGDVPDLRKARFAPGTLDVEDDDVLAGLLVLVDGELVGGVSAVAEVPTPTSDSAFGLILKRDQTAGHVDDLEAPFGLDRLAELRFQRHQAELAQVGRVAVHRVLGREVPEAVILAVGRAVVVDDGPGEADDLVLVQLRFHGALRAFASGVVEWRDVELQDVMAGLTRAEAVVLGVVGPGEFLVPRLAAPGERPVLALGRRENVVVLRLNSVHGEVRVPLILVGVIAEARDHRAGG